MKVLLEQAELAEPEVIVRGDPSSEQVKNIIGLLSSSQSSQKMFFFKNEREYIFDLKDVMYFEANGNKITARIGSESYEARGRLYELEGALGAKGFVRVSKGVLVNVNHIVSVEAEFSGNYIASMKDGAKLVISRKYVKAFRKYVLEVY
ncbi:MAG: LytTR family transcriptional regulator [Oscillospiraceae bacterium]|nr:LytTR family transcriptional regulator [Oscillospiraceae bacterium]